MAVIGGDKSIANENWFTIKLKISVKWCKQNKVVGHTNVIKNI